MFREHLWIVFMQRMQAFLIRGICFGQCYSKQVCISHSSLFWLGGYLRRLQQNFTGLSHDFHNDPHNLFHLDPGNTTSHFSRRVNQSNGLATGRGSWFHFTVYRLIKVHLRSMFTVACVDIRGFLSRFVFVFIVLSHSMIRSDLNK